MVILIFRVKSGIYKGDDIMVSFVMGVIDFFLLVIIFE